MSWNSCCTYWAICLYWKFKSGDKLEKCTWHVWPNSNGESPNKANRQKVKAREEKGEREQKLLSIEFPLFCLLLPWRAYLTLGTLRISSLGLFGAGCLLQRRWMQLRTTEGRVRQCLFTVCLLNRSGCMYSLSASVWTCSPRLRKYDCLSASSAETRFLASNCWQKHRIIIIIS